MPELSYKLGNEVFSYSSWKKETPDLENLQTEQIFRFEQCYSQNILFSQMRSSDTEIYKIFTPVKLNLQAQKWNIQQFS